MNQNAAGLARLSSTKFQTRCTTKMDAHAQRQQRKPRDPSANHGEVPKIRGHA